ncbi:nitroreductase family protein [Ferrimonas sp. SCSIO 43195]|uniref:nitroreductase family protein n=1 Tax=Ferrimonas sp. SCSIO 43195 TaxID=2822844 RepID=UPI002074C287|nr:nitroreductase family protein [Ferrimonas sp. SCSIO 43195]USD39250.1 nitroreductase family protein [Ferrimonas sp. SCSIO 43195]
MQPHDSEPLSDFIEYDSEQMRQRAQLFLQQMRRRHSIRSFSDRPVPRQVIEDCILTAGSAPSGANHQPWHFVAIHSDEVKSQIREQAEALERGFYEDKRAGEEWLEALKPLGTDAHKPYLQTAPWLIAVFSKKRGGLQDDGETTNYYVHESVGIATGFLITALHQAGLATLTHTPKPMSFLSRVCGRSDNERPYMLIVAGYPGEDASIPAHARHKKSLAEIASFL